ncbi:NAD(+) kinase [Campylobacter sp. FMV-PI01]|uniref:NAD kinase n=1 Tax=Campylobacter portucalensis TaxID=2608384 RepID=A0A6L5WGC1_9BACT|nr:NAD(+) kinase [Campylobacter portucalensis]MSN96009.1 NAD(+) kinase [Campylobacter portucalensis]
MKDINLEKKLKFVGIVAKNVKNIAIIEKILKKRDIIILIEEKNAKQIDKKGYTLNEICKKTDLIISLGGDGTLIGVCRKVVNKDVYVLGVYDGRLGFLTDVDLNDTEKFLDEFFDGKYEIERPLILEIKFKKQGSKDLIKFAFNDVVVSRNSVLSMSRVDAYLNEKYFNTYHGDGVIVSSPVGSTAYNMSANGPIIYPLSKVFCITPICSHSLTQRPIVLPSEYKLSFKNSGDSLMCVIIDGQESFEMSKFDNVEVRLNSHVNLIRHFNRDYFEILKNKLHWGHNGGKF